MTTEPFQERVSGLREWFHNLDPGGVRTAPNRFLGDSPALKWRGFEHAIPRDQVSLMRRSPGIRRLDEDDPFEETSICGIPNLACAEAIPRSAGGRKTSRCHACPEEYLPATPISWNA